MMGIEFLTCDNRSPMKFNGKLGDEAQKQVDECNHLLVNEERLKAIRRAGLDDPSINPAFERLAKLAARSLKVPLTIVSIVTNKSQLFKGAYGLPEPFETTRELTIEGSICRYTLNGKEIIAPNASLDPLLKYHPATGPWGIGAFIAIPIILDDGIVLGAFCAVDVKEKEWTENDIEIMRDLTASVISEINLRRKLLDLNHERQLRDRFVASMTHDIRTPLQSAKMSAHMLTKKVPSEIVESYVDKINGSIDRIDKMIKNLLDSSKLETGELIVLNPMKCDVMEVINNTVSEMTELYGERFITHGHGPIIGQFDNVAIRRILENLISNAVKYGFKETPIEIVAKIQDNSLKLNVCNQGENILSADLVSIFTQYHRTESAITGGEKGWGLGLSLVNGLVKAHNGFIEVESHTKITKFSITIPLT